MKTSRTRCIGYRQSASRLDGAALAQLRRLVGDRGVLPTSRLLSSSPMVVETLASGGCATLPTIARLTAALGAVAP
jgi:hypothetical protein